MTIAAARPTRRTLVRGAAWSVPAVSIAAAAPAFAASQAASATAGPALKWGGSGPKHVSWDLTLKSGLRAISTVSIFFTYTPNGGGGAATFNQLEIYSFLPAVDNGWVVTGLPPTGSNTATATHSTTIPAGTTTVIHTDFGGSDNSTGTVTATITVTYVGGGTVVLPKLTTGWTQAPGGGNSEPAPHSNH